MMKGMHQRIVKVFGTIVAISPLIAPVITLAACTTSGTMGFVPLACTELGSKLSDIYSSNDLGAYVNKLFQFALSIGAIAAVIRIGWAGYLYMWNGDSQSKLTSAKTIMSNVALGLLLLLSIYLILYQINPNILKLDAFENSLSQGVR
jgi:hypothetical protein